MATKEQKARYQEVYEAAVRMGAQHPEVIAAQWAVESGWGAKPSGKNNLFGIKAGNGDPNNKEMGSVVMTSEEINGKNVKMPQKFRDYDSIDQSMADRIKFTQENPRYKKAGYFNASTPAEAAMSLDRAGYATKSGYGKLLIDVMKSAGQNPQDGQKYDFSTTRPEPIATNPVPLTPNFATTGNQLAAAFSPAVQGISQQDGFSAYFNQLNDTSDPLKQQEAEQPKVSNRVKYQEQLAGAFGVQPKAELPDYISDLVASIYDSA